jgi:hypothetical protein
VHRSTWSPASWSRGEAKRRGHGNGTRTPRLSGKAHEQARLKTAGTFPFNISCPAVMSLTFGAIGSMRRCP